MSWDDLLAFRRHNHHFWLVRTRRGRFGTRSLEWREEIRSIGGRVSRAWLHIVHVEAEPP